MAAEPCDECEKKGLPACTVYKEAAGGFGLFTQIDEFWDILLEELPRIDRTALMRTCSTMAHQILQYVGVVAPQSYADESEPIPDLALSRAMILHNSDGRWVKRVYYDAIDRSQRSRAKRTVQIIGYCFLNHHQHGFALYAACQKKLPDIRLPPIDCAKFVSVLELIGCPYVDEHTIDALPDLFLHLKRVTVHDCTKIHLAFVVSVDPKWFSRHPFVLDVDFSTPRQYGHAFEYETTGAAEFLQCNKAITAAHLVYNKGKFRPGKSILLSQPTMLQHVHLMLNASQTTLNTYDAKDISRVLHPKNPPSQREKFSMKRLENALGGGDKVLKDWCEHTRQSLMAHPNRPDYVQPYHRGVCSGNPEYEEDYQRGEHLGMFYSDRPAIELKSEFR